MSFKLKLAPKINAINKKHTYDNRNPIDQL